MMKSSLIRMDPLRSIHLIEIQSVKFEFSKILQLLMAEINFDMKSKTRRKYVPSSEERAGGFIE